MDRRTLLSAGAAAAAALLAGSQSAAKSSEVSELQLTDEAWRKRLTPAQFRVLRQAGTEAPYSSPLLNEHRRGVFACAGCRLPLFSSQTKFESGTGWPSFYAALPNATRTSVDRSLFVPRTEVRCRRCGSHLGHVFPDGPPPTGQRYCMNGVALVFQSA